MSAGPINSGQGFNWSDPAYDQGGFHKWNAEGDTVTGCVREIGSHTFAAKGQPGDKDYQGEQTYPVLYLATERGEKELTVSSIDLLEKTKRANPQVGDTYTAHWVATAGKKRIFTVTVVRPVRDVPGYTAAPGLPPVQPNLMGTHHDAAAGYVTGEAPF